MAPLPTALLRKLSLSPDNRDRLTAIVALLGEDGRTTVAAALEAAFPGKALAAQNKALTRLAEAVDEAAKAAGVRLALRLSSERSAGAAGRSVWFDGEPAFEPEHLTEELDHIGDRLIPDARGRPIGPDDKPVIRCFLSYANADRDLFEAFAQALWAELRISKQYQFKTWNDADLLAGQPWDATIREALTRSDVGILAVSPNMLASDYIREVELPVLTDGRVVVPVQLKPIDFERHELFGLDRLQFSHKFAKNKAFSDCTTDRIRSRWAAELATQIEAAIKTRPKPPRPPTPTQLRRTRFAHHLDDIDGLACLLDDAAGRPTTLSEVRLAARPQAEPDPTVPAVDYVLQWVRDPLAPPLFAILGEYGMGKTITCQRVVRAIEEADDPGLPTPLYFDLRRLGDLRSRPTPTLPEILDDCVRRGWRLDPDEPHPTGDDLIRRAARDDSRMLFVFDGLDEALVHLTERDGMAFTRELLRLQPTRGNTTRILVSCRTHFFRTLRDQEQHLTGHDRARVEASHFQALLMTPLREDQVLTYLGHALPDLDPARVMETVRSVHNLEELSVRPYTLKLVASLLPEIEALRAAGRRVYGVTLYRAMVERWLSRDEGKHHLRPDDKARLMRHLAAWTWQRGTRTVPAAELERAFHAWLRSDEELDWRYRRVEPDKLDEDLRTATFLVREDDEDPGFRFAHTSMQEYFLASHLFEALRADRRGDWALPAPSDETMTFFAQLLLEQDDPALIDRLGRWGAPYLAQASELWLRYALRARGEGWPAPSLVGADLSGADLQGWQLEGTADRPLVLDGSRWEGANLRETRWTHARLAGASFERADLSRATWSEVEAPDVGMDGAVADGATFRRVRWPGLRWGGDPGYRPRWIETVRPGSVGGAAAMAPGRRGVLSSSHAGTVSSCAFSPDGARVLSASGDGTLRLWDPRDGRCLAIWQGHTSRVTACVFSPDGTRALSASLGGTLRLWDPRDGRCLATWEGHTRGVQACAFSPDGARALSASNDGTLRLWDPRDGRCLVIWEGHTSGVHACAFSPDGARALSASFDHTLRLWDPRDGRCLATWEGHIDPVIGCAFSPDGARALSASFDHTLRLWDPRDGRCLATWEGHTDPVIGCTFSPDGARALSASLDGTLRLWDPRDGRCLATWEGHIDPVIGCAFSPDGTHALSTSEDGTLRLWDPRGGRCLATWEGHTNPVRACVFSPDGARALSGTDDGTLQLWDPRDGECLAIWHGHTASVTACAFSPDGARALSASRDRTLRLWDPRNGRRLATWEGHTETVTACVFSPEGARALSASNDRTLRLWDARDGRCLAVWEGHTSGVTACAFSPDGTQALSAGGDGTLRLWDARDGRCLAIWEGHTNGVTVCAFSPDGTRALSASRDRTLRLWDPRDGRRLATWEGHTGGVTACTFSPDGARALFASWDRTLRLWDARDGRCLAIWRGHTGPVTACAFTPDGTQALSASWDRTLRLWDVATGRCLRVHEVIAGEHLAWVPHPDGDTVVHASPDAWRYWDWQLQTPDGPEVLPLEAFGPLPT